MQLLVDGSVSGGDLHRHFAGVRIEIIADGYDAAGYLNGLDLCITKSIKANIIQTARQSDGC